MKGGGIEGLRARNISSASKPVKAGGYSKEGSWKWE